jgi:integrase
MLTDVACKNAKPREKGYKLADSESLFLFVSPTGIKTWRWVFRVLRKEKVLTIGRYPAISLVQARRARDLAREQIDHGIDPSATKKQRKAAIIADQLDNFEKVARAWHRSKAKTLSPRYADAVLSRLENNVFQRLGATGIRSITAPMVLEVIRSIEKRGAHDMAHRVRNHISDVFVWAIASGLAEMDPAAVIRKALEPTDPRLRPALVNLDQARAVLLKAEASQFAHWSTKLASRLLALTAARPGVVRLAERSEFEGLDTDQPIWRIPASKMKLTRQRKRDVTWEFVVPLSWQATAVVETALSISPSPQWLFTGIGTWKKPISDSTLSKLYREVGFTGRHVPHGWRSTFSTIMNERAAVGERDGDRAIIDLMLAHAQDGVEPIYNRAAYMPRRREIAQEWADLLMKGLAEPSTLLPRRST